MPALTYFVRPDIQPSLPASGGPPDASGRGWGLLDTVDPGAEATTSPNTGWTVAKIAPTVYSLMFSLAKEVSGSFGATALPSVAPTITEYDACATSDVLNGTIDAGAWALNEKVIAVGSGGDQDGNLRFRIWKCDAAGTFTQLTSAAVDCGVVTNLATTAAQASSGSTPSIGPFTLTNEWLFLQMAWKITGAGGANTRDVVFRKGTAITLVTPNFTAAATTKGPPFQPRTARNFLLRR